MNLPPRHRLGPRSAFRAGRAGPGAPGRRAVQKKRFLPVAGVTRRAGFREGLSRSAAFPHRALGDVTRGVRVPPRPGPRDRPRLASAPTSRELRRAERVGRAREEATGAGLAGGRPSRAPEGESEGEGEGEGCGRDAAARHGRPGDLAPRGTRAPP